MNYSKALEGFYHSLKAAQSLGITPDVGDTVAYKDRSGNLALARVIDRDVFLCSIDDGEDIDFVLATEALVVDSRPVYEPVGRQSGAKILKILNSQKPGGSN